MIIPQTKSALVSLIAQKNSELKSIEKEDLLDNSQKNDYFNRDDIIEIGGQTLDKNDYDNVVKKFQDRDNEVRTHEQSHIMNAPIAHSLKFNYQAGPDGKLYAIGGEVRLDTSIPNNPKDAIDKLDKIIDSVTSVSNMSSADGAIAVAANLNKMLINSNMKNLEN